MATRQASGQASSTLQESPEVQVRELETGDVAGYIADMSHELAEMATVRKLDAVAHYLRLAEAESLKLKPGRRRRVDGSPPAIQDPRLLPCRASRPASSSSSRTC